MFFQQDEKCETRLISMVSKPMLFFIFKGVVASYQAALS